MTSLLSKDSDEVLFLKYREGSMDAFNELLGRFESPLLKYLLACTGNRQQAEDLFQETFARMVERKEYYTPEAPFKYYLFKVARNLVIDASRRRKVRKNISLDNRLPDEKPIDVVATDPDPEQRAIAGELGTALRHAISELREDQREVFLMRENLNLSFEEIAKLTGAPLPTVKSRMLYALRHLRKTLTGTYMKAIGEPCEAI